MTGLAASPYLSCHCGDVTWLTFLSSLFKKTKKTQHATISIPCCPGTFIFSSFPVNYEKKLFFYWLEFLSENVPCGIPLAVFCPEKYMIFFAVEISSGRRLRNMF